MVETKGETGVLTKVLAVIGTALVWFPILATVVTGVIGSIYYRELTVDYLMPAELLPAVLLGGSLLLWAALRARSRRALIGGGFGAAIVLWLSTVEIAEVTGLASGRTEAVGWPWAVVTSSLALYVVSVLVLGVTGALLLRDLFHRSNQDTLSPTG
jgi:hypothetical protein